jgi:predicted transcriptional regulator
VRPPQHSDQGYQAVTPPPAGRPSLAALPATDGESSGRDPAAVRAFIERFTGQLTQMGFPRTPARIFVALLTADSSTLTAAELAELLRTSPASVSSGVRYLLQVGLVAAEGEPGSRRLHYRMSTRVWEDVVQLRERQFSSWAAELRHGAVVLGPATPAGARMAETVRYFEFVSQEITGLLARWRAQSASIGPAEAGAER